MIINVQSFIVILSIDIPQYWRLRTGTSSDEHVESFSTKTTLSGPVFWASILQAHESRQLYTADGRQRTW